MLPGMWDFSSLTRDRTCIPCTARQILNHWTTKEVLGWGCFEGGISQLLIQVLWSTYYVLDTVISLQSFFDSVSQPQNTFTKFLFNSTHTVRFANTEAIKSLSLLSRNSYSIKQRQCYP